ncbi:MAG: hypothetical protein ACJ8BW_01695 [Ktedonobacteraceae bacterium]
MGIDYAKKCWELQQVMSRVQRSATRYPDQPQKPDLSAGHACVWIDYAQMPQTDVSS